MTTHATVWTGLVSGSSGALSVGYAVVKAGDTFVVATSANRTTYGRSNGVAITAADSTNRAFEYQVAGVIPNSITGLGAGLASWVRVDADGALERCTPASGNDIVGKCNTSGDLQISPGVWDSDNYNGGTAVTLPLPLEDSGFGDDVSAETGIPKVAAGAFTFVTAPSGTIVGTSDSQTLTNKTIDADSNTITNIENADIKSGANIAVSKLAAGSDTEVLTTVAGVPTWSAAGGLSVPGSDTEVIFNDGGSDLGADAGLVYNKTTDVLTVAGAVTIGSSAATTGNIRLPNNTGIYGRSTTPDDRLLLLLDSSNVITIGAASSGQTRMLLGNDSSWYCTSGEISMMAANTQPFTLSTNSAARFRMAGTGELLTGGPIQGYSSVNSPWAAHGNAAHTFSSDANYTVTAAQYAMYYLAFTQGSWTISRTITFPHPAAGNGYTKIITPPATGCTISTGTGSTASLSAGTTYMVGFSSAGAVLYL